jgi:cytochrome c biogenesis protein CcmG, thiol:disulfide interchange protein DsbE
MDRGMMKLLTVAALGALFSGCASNGSAPAHAGLGSPAPGFSEPTVSGGTLTMASLAGKPVLLDFFATWCPPCNEEAPMVQAVADKYASAGLRVVGVDVLENAAKAKQFVDTHHLRYPALVDSGTLRDAYNINGMPVTVFIDKTGVVRSIEIGELSRDEMESDIKKIL